MNNDYGEDWETLISQKMRPAAKLVNQEQQKKESKSKAFNRWKKNNPESYKASLEKNKKNVKRWAKEHPERIRELGRKSDAKRRNTPKRKAWEKEYLNRPEVKERRRERDRLRNQTPERKAYERERSKRRREKKKLEKLQQRVMPLENETAG